MQKLALRGRRASRPPWFPPPEAVSQCAWPDPGSAQGFSAADTVRDEGTALSEERSVPRVNPLSTTRTSGSQRGAGWLCRQVTVLRRRRKRCYHDWPAWHRAGRSRSTGTSLPGHRWLPLSPPRHGRVSLAPHHVLPRHTEWPGAGAQSQTWSGLNRPPPVWKQPWHTLHVGNYCRKPSTNTHLSK